MASTVFLDEYEYRVSETIGSVPIRIVRTGTLDGDVTLTYGLLGDTATAGVDFIDPGFTDLTMPAGVAEITVHVPIVDDGEAEPTESFVFSLVNVQGATLFAPRTARVYLLDNELVAPPPPAEPPLTPDYDVSQVALVTGLDSPVKMVASPLNASQYYVAGKHGTISLVDVSTGVVSTVLDIRAKVNSHGDRGMLDIALHPDFAANPYIYVSATIDPPESASLWGNAGLDGAGNRYWQVLRYSADASTGYTTIVPGSEVVLLGRQGEGLADISGGGWDDYTDPAFFDRASSERHLNASDPTPPTVVGGFKQDYLKVDSSSHMGGALAFGPDGALYVSTGDGTSFNYADPRTPDVQSLSSLAGKVLRVDPLTGRGLAENPFVTTGMSLDLNQAKLFQLGLRNPFTMTFDPEGRLLMTDTGWNSYEELDIGGPGANFGWPWYEGGDGGTLSKPPGYRDFAEAGSFYAAVEAGTLRVQAPFRAFAHDSAAPGFQIQAITGGEAVYTGGVYPASMQNRYLFADFVQGEVYTANMADSTDVRFLYQASGYAPIDFVQGADGYIYYLDLVRGEIGRLAIGPLTSPPPPPPGGATTTTIGTGPDTLVLRVSQEAYQGSAQYTVAVDGVQIGGTLTASALKSSGTSDTVNVLGDWATGTHTLTVTFLNDLYEPGLGDRNLFVDGVTYDGVAVPGGTFAMWDGGAQNLSFTDGDAPPPPPPPGDATTTTIGTGPDTLVLKVSQDAFDGSAQYTVAVDGVQIGGTLTASALKSSGTSDTVNVLGDWAAGTHTLTVTFLNDLYQPGVGDRNLYIDGITYDGTAVAGGTAAFWDAGDQSFSFTDSDTGTEEPPPPPPSSSTPTTTTIGGGPDTLILKISQDAYLGSAEYTVAVNGVQIGGTLTASALHDDGLSDTVNVRGNWKGGGHEVTVTFLNNLEGPTAADDRNLYIDGVSYDDNAVAGGAIPVPGSTALLDETGSYSITFA